MKLSDAFDQVTCTEGEAKLIVTMLIANMRDAFPDLHTSMTAEIAEIHEHEEEVPPVQTTSSSPTFTTQSVPTDTTSN